MKFSLNLLVAAAALLPNLITARVIPSDAVANREAFASLKAEVLSNFETTRRDFEPSVKEAQAKRDIDAETIEHIADVASHQLVARGQKEDLAKWNTIHTDYKKHDQEFSTASKEWKSEKDAKKKEAALKKAITELKAEIKGREDGQKLLPGLKGYNGFDQKSVDGHQRQIVEKKACLKKYEAKDTSATCPTGD